MAPGPITAATLVAGARQRHAGAFIALGHTVIEIPLILLLVVGVDTFLASSSVRAGIGMIGGTVLILMGLGLLLSLRKQNSDSAAAVRRLPFG